jgi:hypothetical protein
MKNQSLSILFVIKLNKQNKKGLFPLNVRITYLKIRKQFSTGEFINPLEWNAKHQKARSKTIANQQINLQLEIITANIKNAYLIDLALITQIKLNLNNILKNFFQIIENWNTIQRFVIGLILSQVRFLQSIKCHLIYKPYWIIT